MRDDAGKGLRSPLPDDTFVQPWHGLLQLRTETHEAIARPKLACGYRRGADDFAFDRHKLFVGLETRIVTPSES